MLNQQEIAEMRSEFKGTGALSDDLKTKLFQAVKNGEKFLLGDDNICCKWIDNIGSINYDKMDKNTCEHFFFGTIVDDSNCINPK